MNYDVFTISPFDKQIKRLVKKFPSLKSEYPELLKKLETNPFMGNQLGNNCFKIRMAIKSKDKGKSGGARIITHVQIIESKVFLLAIYDKSEHAGISDNEIKTLLSFIL